MEQMLHLDRAIARWVLLPLTLCMLLVGLARHYLISLLNSPPKPLSRKAIREQRALLRGQLLRGNGRHLCVTEYAARREYLMEAYSEGFYLSKKKSMAGDEDGVGQPEVAPNPLDPAAMDGMIGMLKKQAVMFIPQSILMGWINLFFSGFVLSEPALSLFYTTVVINMGNLRVLARLPFPLTLRFKSMLQRGIDTPDMDVTWVSSLSWYFLNLFGLNSIYTLILGGDNGTSFRNLMFRPSLNNETRYYRL